MGCNANTRHIIAAKVTDKDRHIATLMNYDIMRLLASTRPTLLSYGYPEQVVDSWIEKAEDELRHTRKKMYVLVSNRFALPIFEIAPI